MGGCEMMGRTISLDPSTPLGRRTVVVATGVVLAATVAVLVPTFFGLVRTLGRNVPTTHIESDYAFAVAWAAVLGTGILFWPVSGRYKRDLLLVWLARVGVALVVLPVLEFSTAQMDAYSYFGVPLQVGYEPTRLDVATGTSNVRDLVWLHHRLLPDSFHGLMVTWSYLGLIATYLIYRAAAMLMGRDDRPVFFVLSLFPSVLIWSTLLGKDPVTFLGMGLYIYGIVAAYRRGARRFLLVALAGIVIATFVRSWYAPMMLVTLLPFLALENRSSGVRRRTPIVVQALVVPLLVAAVVFTLSRSRYGQTFQSGDSIASSATSINQSFARGDSANEIGGFAGIQDLVIYLPVGVVTALFRPLPGEVLNPLGLLSGLENLVVLALALVALTRMRARYLRHPVFLWALGFTLLWSAQYGATTAGNLGSLVRYRLQVLPFLLGLVLFTVHDGRRAGPSDRGRAQGGDGGEPPGDPIPSHAPTYPSRTT